jgi:hypothetical protein
LQEIEDDKWAIIDKGSLMLKIHPNIAVYDENLGPEDTLGYQHSGFVICLAWEISTQNLYISNLVPTRYPCKYQLYTSIQVRKLHRYVEKIGELIECCSA